MEIIIGASIALLVEIYKQLAGTIGKEQSKKVVLGVVFVLCFGFAILRSENIITLEMVTNFTTILASAVGSYQLILKPFLKSV